MSIPTIFANSGRRIQYGDVEHRIVKSGIDDNGSPYVEINPPNKEIEQRIVDEIRTKGNLTVRIGATYKLVLGDDEYPYFR